MLDALHALGPAPAATLLARVYDDVPEHLYGAGHALAAGAPDQAARRGRRTRVGGPVVELIVQLLPMKLTFAARPDESVLQAALRAGIGLPSACRNGTCRRCLARCVAGRVRHRIEWPGLSAEEKAAGWVLPCVALAETDLSLELPNVPVVTAAAPP